MHRFPLITVSIYQKHNLSFLQIKNIYSIYLYYSSLRLKSAVNISVHTLDFLRAPLSVRSLVLREVNLPGGVLKFFAWPVSPLSNLKLGVTPLPAIMEPGKMPVSLDSVFADIWSCLFIVIIVIANKTS